MHKVALWGAGDGYNVFTQVHGREQVEVVAIADSKMGGIYKSIDGVPVVYPSELVSMYSYEYLVICVFDKRILDEIIKEAVEMGIKREIILPLRIFKIPFFDFDEYIEIKKSNISILSDYCFAGYLYHKFGMRFTSPTINMYADNDNYLRFLSDIEGHFNQPMVEVENYVDNPYKGLLAYPRGRVGDSEWEFNHDVSFETAQARWKRGVERFNFNNYIVTMAIKSDEAAYKFNALPIQHKIGFYWKELGLDSVVCMPEWNEPEIRVKYGYDFAALVNRVADETGGIRTINWMRALLHKDKYKRVE